MAVILLLIVFTNVRLRGINSVVALLAVAFIAVVLALFGWWDEIAKLIPYLSVHMNTGFYVVFSTALVIIWALMFFVFDRLTYWRIRPAQMTEEHLIGGGAESFDSNGLRFQKLSADFFPVDPWFWRQRPPRDGKVEVAAIDPVASMQAIDNPALKQKAQAIQAKLRNVIEGL